MQAIGLDCHHIKATWRLSVQAHQKVSGRKHNASLLCISDARQSSAMRATPALTHLDKHQRAIAVTKN
jgi:hypothetical protein